MTFAIRRYLLIALTTISFAACRDASKVGGDCKGEQCGIGQECTPDGCADLCSTPADCDPGYRCQGDVCVPNPPNCGDGVVNSNDEECDDGNTSDNDECLNSCEQARCGDGFQASSANPSFHEECDAGILNSDNGACTSQCKVAVCGDLLIHGGVEECDDGNTNDDDGCDRDCQFPCGNGRLNPGEECDDGNTNDNDGCDSNCTTPRCGNGVRNTGEDCDDGNSINGDTCDNNCTFPACGNGEIGAPEECEPNVAVLNGTCSAGCQIACNPGWGDCNGDGNCDQDLTDPNNCGVCGNSCGAAACTSNGLCAPLVVGPDQGAYDVESDGIFVYWLSGEIEGYGSAATFKLKKRNLDGTGDVQVLNNAIPAVPKYLSRSGMSLFVAAAETGSVCDSSFPSCDFGATCVTGGTPTCSTAEAIIKYSTNGSLTPQTLVIINERIRALESDDTHVYWSTDTGIFRIPTGGGTPETLASVGASKLQIEGTRLYALSRENNTWSLILRMPKEGGSSPVVVVRELTHNKPTCSHSTNSKFTDFTVSGTTVYWTDGAVYRANALGDDDACTIPNPNLAASWGEPCSDPPTYSRCNTNVDELVFPYTNSSNYNIVRTDGTTLYHILGYRGENNTPLPDLIEYGPANGSSSPTTLSETLTTHENIADAILTPSVMLMAAGQGVISVGLP